ncbi:MAG: bifunctional diaminohydroxyphosphoribosylaminopyrimidine deaminase/5-amino-6-(5-phosphoribosylamino)uracil reductase RibD [Elusimicrobia bacterium]|nr:bifunctional diaminohydroxyphosphoribosylaminopyrimidine deaminase/5-amino-6-(5-phosphoribosylamino)uracil reductase RibD [Elusimicrobiota bacterium]
MPSDVEYLRRAMRLARKGVGKVSPNPLVGCVLVKGGRIVGEGYHPYFGGPHAEIGALEKAGPKAREAALYVNLEPCNCWGKTGPCTAAILQAGISRVVASMADPDPRVSGKGFQVLRQAGIQVRSGLLEAEARDLNRPYLIWTTQKRPYVILKSAATLDGKIAARNGKSRWISSKASRNYVHRLRSQVDAILVGTRTVLQDDPELTSHGQGKNPVRIILDAGGVLTPQQKVFNGSAQTLLMTSGKNFNLLAKRFEKE